MKLSSAALMIDGFHKMLDGFLFGLHSLDNGTIMVVVLCFC